MYLVVNQPEPGVIEAGRKGTKIDEVERPNNSDEWGELLTTAGIDWVFAGPWGMVSFPAPWEDRIQSNGLVFHHIFIWSDANEIPQCSIEHAGFRCGRCDQPQDERWTIQFRWKPSDREGMSQQDRDACSVDSLR